MTSFRVQNAKIEYTTMNDEIPCMAISIESFCEGLDNVTYEKGSLYLHGNVDSVRAFAQGILDHLPNKNERTKVTPKDNPF
jgi:hypothetical protein